MNIKASIVIEVNKGTVEAEFESTHKSEIEMAQVIKNFRDEIFRRAEEEKEADEKT